GSLATSVTHRPSKPAASARRATPATRTSGQPTSSRSSFTRLLPSSLTFYSTQQFWTGSAPRGRRPPRAGPPQWSGERARTRPATSRPNAAGAAVPPLRVPDADRRLVPRDRGAHRVRRHGLARRRLGRAGPRQRPRP